MSWVLVQIWIEHSMILARWTEWLLQALRLWWWGILGGQLWYCSTCQPLSEGKGQHSLSWSVLSLNHALHGFGLIAGLNFLKKRMYLWGMWCKLSKSSYVSDTMDEHTLASQQNESCAVAVIFSITLFSLRSSSLVILDQSNELGSSSEIWGARRALTTHLKNDPLFDTFVLNFVPLSTSKLWHNEHQPGCFEFLKGTSLPVQLL